MEKIGRYEVKSEIGRGGMATVYSAYDPRFKRDVAVKVLPQELLHDPMFRSRFEREARAIAQLEHSAIVPVYDFGEDENQLYIVMRYMPGGSLADRISEHGSLSVEAATAIIQRIGRALDHAHAKGIIHRDLKPGNILFDQYGDAYLADFGIARTSESGTTLTGNAVIGTPAYMSPEQARGETNIDGRSDVYALGAIIFQMLTGQLPYDAETPMGQLVKHITEPVPRILAVKPDLPPACDTVIAQAMAKARDARYSSGVALGKALAGIAAGQVAAAGTVVAESGTTVAGETAPGVGAPTLGAAAASTKMVPPASGTVAGQAAVPPISEAGRRGVPMWSWVVGALVVIGVLAVAVLNGAVPWAGQSATDLPATTAIPSATQTVAPATDVPAGAPEIELLSHTEGDRHTIVLGETLLVQAAVSSDSGVRTVELLVDNDGIDFEEVGGSRQYASKLQWEPTQAGRYTVGVQALGSDGLESDPVYFIVEVVDPTVPPPTPAPSNTPVPTSTPPGGTDAPEVTPTPTHTRAAAATLPSGGGPRSVDGTFTASATNINPGQTVTLFWDYAANRDFIFSIEIWEFTAGASQPVRHVIAQSVKSHSGSRAFTPSATTTYRLDIYYNDANEQPTVQQHNLTVNVAGSGGSSGGPVPGASPTTGGSGQSVPFSGSNATIHSCEYIANTTDFKCWTTIGIGGGTPPFQVIVNGDPGIQVQQLNTNRDFGFFLRGRRCIRIDFTWKITDASFQVFNGVGGFDPQTAQKFDNNSSVCSLG